MEENLQGIAGKGISKPLSRKPSSGFIHSRTNPRMSVKSDSSANQILSKLRTDIKTQISTHLGVHLKKKAKHMKYVYVL